MNQRELELIHRAEAAERAIVEAVRQRDILLSACQDMFTRLEWWDEESAKESLNSGFATLRLALEKVNQ